MSSNADQIKRHTVKPDPSLMRVPAISWEAQKDLLPTQRFTPFIAETMRLNNLSVEQIARIFDTKPSYIARVLAGADAAIDPRLVANLESLLDVHFVITALPGGFIRRAPLGSAHRYMDSVTAQDLVAISHIPVRERWGLVGQLIRSVLGITIEVLASSLKTYPPQLYRLFRGIIWTGSEFWESLERFSACMVVPVVVDLRTGQIVLPSGDPRATLSRD